MSCIGDIEVGDRDVNEVHITTTISGDLIAEVRTALFDSLDAAMTGNRGWIGENASTPRAYAAYVTSVAAVEAFVNETFLQWTCSSATSSSALWQIPESSLERMDLLLKVVVFPQLLFGAAPKRDAQPFQDFALLCRIRNDLVHFKMSTHSTPKYVHTLAQRGIALVHSPDDPGPWPWKLSCTEGIRWAHNTACEMALHMASLIPESQRERLAHGAGNFRRIQPEAVSHWIGSKSVRDAMGVWRVTQATNSEGSQ
jgi:hypothetical protein